LHPETKFLNGDYTDQGKTKRRHILVKSIQHIGKEANKWEEQFFMGLDTDALIEYGMSPEEDAARLNAVLESIERFGIQPVAITAGLSRRCVWDIYHGNTSATGATIYKLEEAARKLSNLKDREHELRQNIKRIMTEKGISGRDLAKQLGMDSSNFAKVISGSRGDLMKLERIYKILLRGS
jgi:hypothetical protein